MLISVNKDVDNSDFENLLDSTIDTLYAESKKAKDRYLKLLGNKLEDEVFDVMNSKAINTPFEGTIELISGQKFPDIIANNFYGVEVKSTKQNHWKTMGNSVLESTRVKDIRKIYMLFGKIHEPIEFKFRPYEECLYDVIVTHSPRYAIDMNLQKGKTIFDKVTVDYDVIRQSSNPIKPFKDYYRNKLAEGQELWWLENEEYSPDSIIFKLWKTIPLEEKKKIKIAGQTYFPEILSNSNHTKYDRFTLWLSVKKRIICPSVRDLYSAGGQKNLVIQNTTLELVPKVIINFIKNIDLISSEFSRNHVDSFNEVWKSNFLNKEAVKKEWLDRVVKASSSIYDFGSFQFRQWLEDKINAEVNKV